MSHKVAIGFRFACDLSTVKVVRKREPSAKCLVLSIKLKINRSRFKPLRSVGALMTSSVTAFLGPGAGCEDTCEFVPPSGIP